jgi:putative ABC transport system permease protein
MLRIALQMLIAECGKLIGMVLGLALTSFVIAQQPAFFLGILQSTYSLISDTEVADLWVMDPKVRFVDDSTPMADSALARVRSVEGVAWAVGLFRGNARARLANGDFESAVVIGLDDATLLGGPAEFVEGSLASLRRSDAVLINEGGATKRLATKGSDGKPVPIRVGDVLELNERRAVVAGIYRAGDNFNSQTTLYAPLQRAKRYVPGERKTLSFILAGARDPARTHDVARAIRAQTGLEALPSEDFKRTTRDFFIANTGVIYVFGFSAVFGMLIGSAIAAQAFFGFVRDNLRYFGVLKAIGATAGQLRGMAAVQAFVAALLGYGIGMGALAAFAQAMGESLTVVVHPWLLLIVLATVLALGLGCAVLAMRRVVRLDPSTVFRT